MKWSFHFIKKIKIGGTIKNTEWLEQPSAEELTSMIMNEFCQDLSQVSPLKRKKKLPPFRMAVVHVYFDSWYIDYINRLLEEIDYD